MITARTGAEMSGDNFNDKLVHSVEYQQGLGDGEASLRQQLADSQKREVMLREKFQELADNFMWSGDGHSYHHWVIEVSKEALTATADLQDVILCHAEPSLYFYPPTGKTLHASRIEESRKETWEPLYRAWEPK